MTKFYLIRHAVNDLVGKAIAGRMPGISLNAEGRRQAAKLAERLSSEPIRHIFSSPLERCRETATPLACRLGIEIQISENFNEIDFGNWTGKTLDELRLLDNWRQWNQFRSSTRIPNGELMSEVQGRMIAELEQLQTKYPNDAMAILSHGDPIRAALVYYLGVSIDLISRIDISSASVSILELGDFGPRITRLNDCG